jgi:hypothetical protein
MACPARATSLALLCALAGAASHAESLASSASSAGSVSVGSLSDSIAGSSNSSSRNTRTADGDYRVTAVADATDRPGALRLTLQPQAAGTDPDAGGTGTGEGAAPASTGFVLTLPRAALGARGIAVGDTVTARNRPYGLEFSRSPGAAAVREPFFLVLRDDWHRELGPQAVRL